MPEGLAPADPRAVHWHRATTLAASLEKVGVKPADIKFVAISHTHPDHIGNVELFPQATLLVQKAEYEWPGQNGAPRFKPEHPVIKLDGDHDVFGDGSVMILTTPGHTPGHQSLLVTLPKAARSCFRGMPSTSRRTGTIAACPRTTSTKKRRSPRWTASPT